MEPGPIGDWRERYAGSRTDPKEGGEILDRSPASHGGTFYRFELVAIHDPEQPGRRVLIRRRDFNPETHTEWGS